MPKWLQQLFTFTDGEQKGIIALVVVCLLVFIAPGVYLYFKPVQHISNTATSRQIDAFISEYEQADTSTDDNAPVAQHAANKGTYNSRERTPQVTDINQATAADFEKLNGIGTVLATRIVKFRAVLGGFASIAQLHEVYGLPDSTYNRISRQLTVKAGQVQQVNINSGSYKHFKTHPYLRPFAKSIETYRTKNGNYKQPADLKNITGITDSIYHKIAPYIAVE